MLMLIIIMVRTRMTTSVISAIKVRVLTTTVVVGMTRITIINDDLRLGSVAGFAGAIGIGVCSPNLVRLLANSVQLLPFP